MSRVGKRKINVPDGVRVDYGDGKVMVEGKLGSLFLTLNTDVSLLVDDKVISVVVSDDNKTGSALQGLTRSLIVNMVSGVSVGFEKMLEINGIGYKAELKGKKLLLNLGYSHPINFELPEGVEAKVDKNIVKLFGINKEKLGQTAASIRQLRPLEPYKGKGIKYVGEYVRRKAGKTGAK